MDKIFKWFILDEAITVVRLTWFVQTFPVDEFTGVSKMIMLFLTYCCELNLIAKRSYLEVFLRTEGKKYIKKYKIRLDTMEKLSYDEPAQLEEAFRIITNEVLSHYDKYCQEDLTDRNFKVDVKAFMETQKTTLTQGMLMKVFPSIQNGADIDEVLETIAAKAQSIQSVYDKGKMENLDFLSGERYVRNGQERMRFLFKTGLPCMDGDTGGVYSKQLVSLTSQPGAGKTRLACAHFVYQAAVVYKQDVLFDELEMSRFEVENILISFHIVNLYKGKYKIPDTMINEGLLDETQSRIVEAARMDLFESGKYGKIVVRDKLLQVETIFRDAKNFLKLNPKTTFWVIDYAGLVQSNTAEKEYGREKLRFQIITEVYEKGKQLAKDADIAILLINQFTKEGNEKALAGKMIIAGDVEGGQVVQRHSDYDLVMCMTEQQALAGIRTLSTAKKRGAAGFKNVTFRTDLAVSIFTQTRLDATN